MQDEASGSLTAFLAGGVVFLISIGTIVWTTQSTGRDDGAVDEAASKSQAEALLETLMGSGGQGYDPLVDPSGLGVEVTINTSGASEGVENTGNQVEAGEDAALDGDGVERMGLRSPSGGMELGKMDVLRGAADLSSANGLLDYEDARVSLGLTSSSQNGLEPQFHLRIYPVGGVTGIGEIDLSQVRTAYVGDWTELAKVYAAYQVNDDEATVQDADAELNLTMGGATYDEREMLAGLGLDFRNRVYMTTGYPQVMVQLVLNTEVPMTTLVDMTLWRGDVYPDDKSYLTATLPNRLEQYDLLVIGSGVDQQSLVPNAVKDAIRDWVLDGGSLVVLGSSQAGTQWLQPIFDVKTTTVNGAPYAGDPSHPLLTTPHALDWASYPATGRAWDLGEEGEDVELTFSRVIVADDEALLAVSNEGTYGAGRIFLSAYSPSAIAEDLGEDEALAFLENILRYVDDEGLYLDYGPPVPEDTRVASAVRHTYIVDDDLGQVPMRVELLFWYA